MGVSSVLREVWRALRDVIAVRVAWSRLEGECAVICFEVGSRCSGMWV